MNRRINIIFFLLIGFLFLLSPIKTLASSVNTYQLDSGDYVHYEGLVPCGKDVWVTEDEEGLNNGRLAHVPCQFCHLFIMLSAIISFLLTLLIPILAVGMLVVAGIMYYLALGNPAKLARANSVFKGVVIGLVLIYGAWLIVGALFSVLGVAEWTGLQSGWYKINCPIKSVVYEPGEVLGNSEFCPEGSGVTTVGGMTVLCSDKGLMSQTFETSLPDRLEGARETCAALPSPSGGSDEWRIANAEEYGYFMRHFEEVRCGNSCKSWDSKCCAGMGNNLYMTGETEVKGWAKVTHAKFVNMSNGQVISQMITRDHLYRCFWQTY